MFKILITTLVFNGQTVATPVVCTTVLDYEQVDRAENAYEKLTRYPPPEGTQRTIEKLY